ncbi:sigma-54 dependent transcriptional regulator [bacterium]|nr:sigma-54 dependent transcriptional regulator [bacterium]
MAFKIMIVEDCRSYRQQLLQTLGAYAELDAYQTFDTAKAAIEKNIYEVYVLDKQLPDGMDGEDLIPVIRTDNPNAIIIMLTADSDYNTAKRCLAKGADEYIIKAPNIVPELLVRIPMCAARAATERQLNALQDQIREVFKYEIIGKSLFTSELRSKIYSLKGSQSPVLITGERGTGKELVARRVHAIEDGRRPFVIVNCAAIPENLIESELFGCKRGAFTGAVADRAGKFELAHKGDIFLDEIGEMPIGAQAKLLRVIQDGQFFRVGGDKPIQVNCRVIAATNKDLPELARRRKFRDDLYDRLNVMQFVLAPLRERLEDIPDLARFLLIKEGGSRFTITERAIKRLMQHRWPGNIRELGNTIERAKILVKQRESTEVDAEDITFDRPLGGPAAVISRLEFALPTEIHELTPRSFEEFKKIAEREYIRNGLELTDGHAMDFAQRVGFSKGLIYKKMSQLGIPRRTYGLRTETEPETENSSVDLG